MTYKEKSLHLELIQLLTILGAICYELAQSLNDYLAKEDS